MNIYPQIAGVVTDWDVIVCGHLRWNRYFGESAENPPRGDPSTCGSALITGRAADGSLYRLLVDPTLRLSADAYDFDINRRTGLRLKDITHCFSTHHHADHVQGLRYFPNALWCAAEDVIPLVSEEDIALRLTAVSGEFLPGVYALPLPGHTASLHGIAFAHGGKRILIAGDAVMTKGHFANSTTEFQTDPVLIKRAAGTIADIRESFDIVLPGHDNPICL